MQVGAVTTSVPAVVVGLAASEVLVAVVLAAVSLPAATAGTTFLDDVVAANPPIQQLPLPQKLDIRESSATLPMATRRASWDAQAPLA
jgi:ABC-type transport system involved in cytochrome c biogenesis permease component